MGIELAVESREDKIAAVLVALVFVAALTYVVTTYVV